MGRKSGRRIATGSSFLSFFVQHILSSLLGAKIINGAARNEDHMMCARACLPVPLPAAASLAGADAVAQTDAINSCSDGRGSWMLVVIRSEHVIVDIKQQHLHRK
jgi:hypothetical protein